MTPSPALRAIGAAVAATVFAGAVAGVAILSRPEPAARHFRASRPVPPTCAEAQCYEVTALTSQAALALGGVSRGEAPEYVHARIKACPGEAAASALPPGMVAIDDTARVVPCPADAAELKVWVQGEPSAPFPCACSTGSDCTVDGKPAPLGVTLAAGTFTGAGCFPKVCVVLAGNDQWPSEHCPGGAP